jgi:hypothetical protein
MPYQSTPKDRRRALALGVYYVLLAIALAYMLFMIWPPVPWPDPNFHREAISKALAECGYPTPAPTPAPSESPATVADQQKSAPVVMPINFFFKKCVMTSFDERLLLLVIVAGILGSFVHGATSLADYIGNDCFNRKWTWFYLLRPVIGMALALVFYFVIRGGFLTTNVGATDINPYGIAALAGLVGMFSKQATDKLSEVFSTLFKSGSGEGDEKRADPLRPKPTTIAINIDPPEVIAGSEGLNITVAGTDFVEGSTIFLNDSPQPTTFESDTQLSAQVAKETVANPSILKLTVVNPDLARSAPLDFKVVAATTARPAVASVDPAEVPAGSTAQKITVSGSGFVDGSSVNLNDVAQDTTFGSPTQLTAQIDDALLAAPATLKLKVVNEEGSESPPIDFTVS